jgi:hypothetical protein
MTDRHAGTPNQVPPGTCGQNLCSSWRWAHWDRETVMRGTTKLITVM